ncbi:T9SS type A sorting domain-containing protein [Spirosoma foliorum]|uniref:T9SS type A sorting domain-containing protein n=1 Tax=Spirosoma foliorum TaxID=2710596 RepID=A0A7G5GV73_9BACT|nr:T9SS type A sorting domain-containing protein [Spirosoma foliorum]QMW02765.1 T9SS type A sorting domain-containing protein [Spirosoma foliorum]
MASFAQVATYTFTSSDPGNQTSKAVTSKDANITASDITRGAGISPVTTISSINSSDWNSSTQNATDYYEFTLTPNTGYQLNLTGLNLTERRSNTGPTTYLIAYSIAGGSETTVSTGPLSGTVDAALNISLSIQTAQSIRFRIYAWGATSNSGTFRLNNSLTVTGAAPLPVKLIGFSGQSIDNSAVLNWSTGWEVRNAGFDILRSSTISNFEKVGFVKGSVSTQEVSVYSFTDPNVQNGQVYYYRLKQNNEDGSSELSNIIAVRIRSDMSLSTAIPVVYPNPNQGSFSLSTQGLDITKVSLYNAGGVEIPITVNTTKDSSTLTIEVTAPIASGLYILRFQTADGAHQPAVKVLIK